MRTLLLFLTVLLSLTACGESDTERQAREQAENHEKLNAYNAQVQQKFIDSNAALEVDYPSDKK
jgi:outer membrane lipoprotein-sorting protein